MPDARLVELQLLSEIERKGQIQVNGFFYDGLVNPRREMIAFLLVEGFLNDPTQQSWQYGHGQRDNDLQQLRNAIDERHWEDLNYFLGGQPVTLRLSHKGRVRMAELRQALKVGRARERFGLLWEARHFQQDLEVALTSATTDRPVAVAYLDMNGLKEINDTFGHDAGDLAIRAYFESISSALGDRGEVYQLLRGDEVGVILDSIDPAAIVGVFEAASTKLMRDRLRYGDEVLPTLSMAVGIVAGIADPKTSPDELRSSAERAMYRAKAKTKEGRPRPSAIAVGDDRDVIVLAPPSMGLDLRREDLRCAHFEVELAQILLPSVAKMMKEFQALDEGDLSLNVDARLPERGFDGFLHIAAQELDPGDYATTPCWAGSARESRGRRWKRSVGPWLRCMRARRKFRLL